MTTTRLPNIGTHVVKMPMMPHSKVSEIAEWIKVNMPDAIPCMEPQYDDAGFRIENIKQYVEGEDKIAPPINYHFEDGDNAILFKLTWSGK